MELDLQQKKILITGASQGIGKKLAFSFAQEGCDIHLISRSAIKLEEIAQQIKENYTVNVSYTAIDMVEEGACQRIVDEAGRIDILINNAGVVPAGDLASISAEKWREGWALKGFGYIDMIRLVYHVMKKAGGGVIINNIGSGGEVCDPSYIEGAACNASLMAITKALGGSSLNDNIRVVGVNPGPVKTERISKMMAAVEAENNVTTNTLQNPFSHFPLGRPAEPQEVVDLILFLASARASYISGSVITIDGGLSARRKVF